jgi:hypothetical protein
MADQSAASNAKARIFAPDDTNKDFTFALNPSKLSRERAPTYADVPIALANFGSFDQGPAPIEWVRNKPEDISIEFMLHAEGKGNVDPQLQALDDLLEKDSRSGEPLDLVFRFGTRSDLVRITHKRVDERIWNDDLSVLQAMVQLTMRTIRPRIPG